MLSQKLNFYFVKICGANLLFPSFSAVIPNMTAHKIDLRNKKMQDFFNIAGRLPEKSRNRFKDRRSKKQ